MFWYPPDAILLCELIRQGAPILNWKVKSSKLYGKMKSPMLIFVYRVDLIRKGIWSESKLKCEISFCSQINSGKCLCSYLNTDIVVCEVESKLLWDFHKLGMWRGIDAEIEERFKPPPPVPWEICPAVGSARSWKISGRRANSWNGITQILRLLLYFCV